MITRKRHLRSCSCAAQWEVSGEKWAVFFAPSRSFNLRPCTVRLRLGLACQERRWKDHTNELDCVSRPMLLQGSLAGRGEAVEGGWSQRWQCIGLTCRTFAGDGFKPLARFQSPPALSSGQGLSRQVFIYGPQTMPLTVESNAVIELWGV